ncbi:MAG: hypothetical protein IPP03_08660 [Dechloromonas sp.]|nr:hypothetical protein [Candidatus Dechloromonas phosphoritropha]
MPCSSSTRARPCRDVRVLPQQDVADINRGMMQTSVEVVTAMHELLR